MKIKCYTIIAAFLLGGCASTNYSFDDEGAYDPLEPVNRKIYGFNRVIDSIFLKPISQVYSAMPSFPRNRVSDFFNNLDEPRNVANHLLQINGASSVNSLGRLIINSTAGVGGLFDVADKIGLKDKDADFGGTLRAYTTNDWAYVVLPFWGPSNIADATGSVVDVFAHPISYVKEDAVIYGLSALDAIDKRAKLLDAEELLEGALDEYTYTRDLYEDFRRQQVPHSVWDDADSTSEQ